MHVVSSHRQFIIKIPDLEHLLELFPDANFNTEIPDMLGKLDAWQPNFRRSQSYAETSLLHSFIRASVWD